MIQSSYPYYLANKALQPNTDLEVLDKYSGKVATRVAIADPKVIDEAIGAAVRATDPMRQLPPFERQKILNHCVRRFEQRKDELAMALCIEAGKPIRDSRGEVRDRGQIFILHFQRENLGVRSSFFTYLLSYVKNEDLTPFAFIERYNQKETHKIMALL